MTKSVKEESHTKEEEFDVLAKMASLRVEERTPKRIKSMDPDLTVVVGGVEFFHYRSHLCATCPFFDHMLSANMKESRENRIEFPDKDPEQWLNIYKHILNPEVKHKNIDDTLRSLAFGFSRERDLRGMMELLSWFDFLGFEGLATKYDGVMSFRADVRYANKFWDELYTNWCMCKYFPCPRLLAVMKKHLKQGIHDCVEALCSGRSKPCNVAACFRDYLLDDICGDEVLEYLISIVEFPDTMLEDLDRETIVNAPMFWHVVEVCGKQKHNASATGSISFTSNGAGGRMRTWRF